MIISVLDRLEYKFIESSFALLYNITQDSVT